MASHLNARQFQQLLDSLCVDLGFCLTPDEQAKLCAAPPADVQAFTDAVIRAEGLDPLLADRKLHRAVSDNVAKAYAKAVD